MSSHATIVADLQARLDRLHHVHYEKPDNLPITLDELAWLADQRTHRPNQPPYMPTYWNGVPLRLVVKIVDVAGGVVVTP